MAAASDNSSLHGSNVTLCSPWFLSPSLISQPLSFLLNFPPGHQQLWTKNQQWEISKGIPMEKACTPSSNGSGSKTRNSQFITRSGNRSPHTSAFCPWCWCFIVPPTWTWVCKNFPLQSKTKRLLWFILGRKWSITVQYWNTSLQVLSMSSILYNSTIISIQNFPRPFWNRN